MKPFLFALFITLISLSAYCQKAGTNKGDSTRVVFSSGGSSGNQSALPNNSISIGETFLGSASNGTIGSQQNSTVNPGEVKEIVTEMDKITVYPNPVSNELKIDIAGKNQQNFSVKLFDITGKELFSAASLNEKTLVDMSKFVAGNYTVSIFNKEGAPIYNVTLIKK